MGAFHYAKPTGQRSVGKPEENGTTFSDSTRPTNRNDSYHFKFFFQIRSQLGQRTGLSKMERRPQLQFPTTVKVHLQKELLTVIFKYHI